MIDGWLRNPWPAEVLRDLARFKQGHVVANPPFFYAATPRHGVWALTQDAGDRALDGQILQLDEDVGPQFGMITTQTCDIEEPGTARKPWVQIAPVYDIEESIKESRGHLLRDRFAYLIHLDHPGLGDGLWVADFRIQFPVEKSWLVGRATIEAFGEERRYLDLAEKLASQVERPGVDQGLNIVFESIRRFWGSADAEDVDACDDVSSVRVLLTAGDRLNPTAAHVLVLTDQAAMRPERQARWNRWHERTIEAAAEAGLNLGRVEFSTMDACSARRFREAIRVIP